MKNYIGLIHKDADSDYGVSFPDFPGLVTAGVDLDDARTMAQEALAFHVDGMIADGDEIPDASSLEQIMAEPANRDSVVILVALEQKARKVVRVNVTFPQDILLTIDAFAADHGLTRSGFLAKAALREIAERQVVAPRESRKSIL